VFGGFADHGPPLVISTRVAKMELSLLEAYLLLLALIAVVGLFPIVELVLRLVSAVLMETDERWHTGKRYLNMNIEVNN